MKESADTKPFERSEETDPPWTPFERTGQVVRNLTYALPDGVVWQNSRYLVVVRSCGDTDVGLLIWLSIKRVDSQPCRDWRELQRIKNELLGEEVEAVELYPAESRLVDTANNFHLWAIPGFRFPFGFTERLVAEGTEGVSQRPFPPDNRPADLVRIRLKTVADTREPERSPVPSELLS